MSCSRSRQLAEADKEGSPLRCLQPTTLPGDSSSLTTNIRTKKITSQPKRTWSRSRRELKLTCQAQSHVRAGMIDIGMSSSQKFTIQWTFHTGCSRPSVARCLAATKNLQASSVKADEAPRSSRGIERMTSSKLPPAWAGGLVGFGGRNWRDPPSRLQPIGHMEKMRRPPTENVSSFMA